MSCLRSLKAPQAAVHVPLRTPPRALVHSVEKALPSHVIDFAHEYVLVRFREYFASPMDVLWISAVGVRASRSLTAPSPSLRQCSTRLL